MEPTIRARGYSMGWVGAQQQVLAGDLSAPADLRDLARLPHAYALGPLAELRGEVTIMDGVPYISTVAAGAVAVEQSFARRACFLVYAQVPRWQCNAHARALVTLADLDPILEGAAASATGIDPGEPFPFLVSGRAEAATIHVLDKRDGLPHNPARHEEAKIHFELRDEDVELIGFRSTRHQGVFVPRGSTMHIHVTARGGRLAGHLDALQLIADWRLALPAAASPEDRT